ncbi:MAG: SDR family NAD(P)-dependent oxidoreductase [Elusimicrobia bacterium]|nr:SDR family NAD(P)-dependent oxidoreductase [Elusimicrobiota bacterium]
MPGRRVLITGATSGLGRELALQLAREGCRLALTGRREERLKETARAVSSAGGAALALAGDVRDPACVQRHYAAIKKELGGLDWAILNAGISKSSSARDRFSSEDFRRVYETNVFGPVYWIEAVLPDMLAARSGVIAGIASVAGFRGLPRSGAYSSSKAALIATLESLRVDLRGSGVEVVIVCPGFIRTELTEKWKPEDMPFLIEPEAAARKAIAGIKARRRIVHFPWPFSAAVKYVVRNMPGFLYDRVASRATRRRLKQS